MYIFHVWSPFILFVLFHDLTLGQRSEKQWKIATPVVSPYFHVDPHSNETTGLMHRLFEETSELSVDNFTVYPIQTWFQETSGELAHNLTSFEAGALNCIAQINESENSPDSCLALITLATMRVLDGPIPPLVIPLGMNLKPVLMATCVGQQCPRRMSPSVLQSLYFLRSFNSSVWSLLLLCILTVASALFVFERTPLIYVDKNSRESNDGTDCFNLTDSLLRVLLGLLLQPYPKFPRAWAGTVLLLFWYAFCLIVVIAYALGTSKLIFQTPAEVDEYSTTLYLSPNSNVLCERNSPWCDILKANSGLHVTELRLPRDASGQLSVPELNLSFALITDQLTASSLENRCHNDAQNNCSGQTQWFPAQFDCSAEFKAMYIPSLSLGFVTSIPEAAWRISQHMQVTEWFEVYGCIRCANVAEDWLDW
ncbi:unnamed protein product [Dicrocoelium dendriticum]|nr:unnamed protein product [Dicrocoelium dendriticum]CAH8668373.1 unnamed protein product [Dicrocoelium dendriticum]